MDKKRPNNFFKSLLLKDMCFRELDIFNDKISFCENKCKVLFKKDKENYNLIYNNLKRKKCLDFYANIKLNGTGIYKCPYNFCCIVYKSHIMTSINYEEFISEKEFNQRLSRGQIQESYRYPKEDILFLKDFLQHEYTYEQQKMCFHDLKHLTSPAIDFYNNLSSAEKTEFAFLNLVEKFKEIIVEHNKAMGIISELDTSTFENQSKKRFDITKCFDKTFESFSEISCNIELLSKRYNPLTESVRSLTQIIGLIEYRIRYYEKVISEDFDTSNFEPLNPHRMLTKLIKSLNCVHSDGHDKIIFNSMTKVSYDIFSVNECYLVFYIILENALKYRTGPTVSVDLSMNDNVVKIIFTNDYKSESITNVSKLFERGVRGTSNLSGTGYGLYIVKNLLEASGWNVKIDVAIKNKFSLIITFDKNTPKHT